MTQVEREKMINDKWPVFSKKNKREFLEFIEEASKAKLFDVDECDCDKNKRFLPC